MRFFAVGVTCVALLASTAAIVPAAAQDTVERRVDKIEKELRAVQRKVFPGSDGAYFEPDIVAPPAGPGLPGASAPLTDAIARLDSIEAELARITGQVEGLTNRQRQLDDAFAAFKASVDTRLAAPAATVSGEPGAAPATRPGVTTPRADGNARAAAKPAAAKPSADRVAAIRAVEVPDTGDKGEDAYLYGYRLWEAKLYPEAQMQLKKAADDYPKHKRASHTWNLLGRAYLDDGDYADAAKAFGANFQKYPDGDRAPHSVMYLGAALTQMGRKADACIAYRELDKAYGGTMPADVKRDAAAGRKAAGCT